MVAPEVVIATTSGATIDDKVGIMITLGFKESTFPIVLQISLIYSVYISLISDTIITSVT